MTDRRPRLDIERARAALSRTHGAGADALRSPRPADLRHLREDRERKAELDVRITRFRDGVRGELGLGDYAGPFSAVELPGAAQTGHALCDADICAPEPPRAPAAHVDPPPPAPAPAAPALSAEPEISADAGEGPYALDAGEPDVTAPPPPPRMKKKRRKFLGIF